MKTARMRSGLLALLVLLAATAACTNSEQLSSGVAPVPIQIQIVNPDTRFDRAFFDLIQVTVRPVDPQASEVLGTDPLWMMQTTDEARFEINLNADEDQFSTDSQLTIGVYEIQSVSLQILEFNQGVRLGDATCSDYVTDYPLIQTSVQLVDFGEPVMVNVTPGAESQLKMVIDGAALSEAFANSWNCAQGAPGCGFFNAPPWCLFPNTPQAFNPSAFSQQGPNFISFE